MFIFIKKMRPGEINKFENMVESVIKTLQNKYVNPFGFIGDHYKGNLYNLSSEVSDCWW